MSLEVIDKGDRGMIAGAEFDQDLVARFEVAFAEALDACIREPECK